MSLNNAEKVLFWHDNALKFKNLFTGDHVFRSKANCSQRKMK